MLMLTLLLRLEGDLLDGRGQLRHSLVLLFCCAPEALVERTTPLAFIAHL